MTVLYPVGYQDDFVTEAELRAIDKGKLHPEFEHRVFPWIVSMRGLIGIGDMWRAVQPVGPGFAPAGRSFHLTQKFKSGIEGCSAVDLVARGPIGYSGYHRAPTWAESATAPLYGLHTFVTGEPWHMQCLEIRGFGTWEALGRPDPLPFTLPGEDDMQFVPSVPPKRLLDTRDLGNKVAVGQVVRVSIPGGAASAMLNFTVTQPGGAGYLTAWGGGETPPTTSNVNFVAGETVANAAAVPVDNGVIRFTVSGSPAHVVVDLQGVFT